MTGRRPDIAVPEVRTALVLSWVALLGFFARSIIDFVYVYPEQLPDLTSVVIMIVVYTVVIGGWIGALLALAAGRRQGAIACLGFSLLPILLGLSVAVVFCPFPCATAAPVADILNVGCLVLGVISAVNLVLHLRSAR